VLLTAYLFDNMIGIQRLKSSLQSLKQFTMPTQVRSRPNQRHLCRNQSRTKL